jgi:hypothetical protein
MLSSALIPSPVAARPAAALEEYCKELISYFDRYGASRTANSDGRRNHARIGAEIDCEEGAHQEGVDAMICLLERKRFEVPPPPTGVAQTPSK